MKEIDVQRVTVLAEDAAFTKAMQDHIATFTDKFEDHKIVLERKMKSNRNMTGCHSTCSASKGFAYSQADINFNQDRI